MVKLLTAYTREVDDPEKAVREIQERLNLTKERRSHCVILIFCHSLMIESGIMEAVSHSLPGPLLGCSCQFFALPGAADEIMLTVAALTSDDVAFAVGVSGPLNADNLDERIGTLYRELAGSEPEPSLIFALQPTMLNLSGDRIAAAIDRACGGIPVFGSGALDMDTKIRNPKTIFQGAVYGDRAALLLFKGECKPRFFSRPFPGKSISVEDAVITGVAGNLITGINNIPAAAFMQRLGIVQQNGKNDVLAFPLVIDYHDGTESHAVVMRGITADGALITSRYQRLGGVLSLGSITACDVLESAGQLVQDIRKSGGKGGIIIFSCFLRNIILGGNSMAEIELIQKGLSGFPSSYLLLYSGGELCPAYTGNEMTVNHTYQYALTACQF